MWRKMKQSVCSTASLKLDFHMILLIIIYFIVLPTVESQFPTSPNTCILYILHRRIEALL